MSAKKLLYITRKAHFNAAHKLYNPKWSQEENEAVFGKCANKNWHGHNFDLYVTVKGSPSPDTGFIMDLKKLNDIIQKQVVDVIDHRNLNIDVPFMEGQLASIENLAVGIWEQIVPHLAHCELHRIKLWETHNNYVEYFGETMPNT
ncbi:MAG: 6-pyruvoyltetrahydropterin/6-carboxytetrahydropterin synthase [Bacteroidia bacterium]|jgi:6-pyruvoyltetrahydropterin/6-carboxytetrahydropterin synthase